MGKKNLPDEKDIFLRMHINVNLIAAGSLVISRRYNAIVQITMFARGKCYHMYAYKCL